jgi:hypothetical protein
MYKCTHTLAHSQEDSTSASAAEQFAKYCLLVKPQGGSYEDIMGKADVVNGFYSAPAAANLKKLPDFSKTVFASEQGDNKWCIDGFNTRSEYTYVYKEGESGAKAGDKETVTLACGCTCRDYVNVGNMV